MRRIKLVLAVVAMMAAMMAASAVPAMANTNDHVFRDNNGGRFFFDNNNRNGFVLFNSSFNSPFFTSSFPGFDAFGNNVFDGINNGFNRDHNFFIQRVG